MVQHDSHSPMGAERIATLSCRLCMIYASNSKFGFRCQMFTPRLCLRIAISLDFHGIRVIWLLLIPSIESDSVGIDLYNPP